MNSDTQIAKAILQFVLRKLLGSLAKYKSSIVKTCFIFNRYQSGK